MTRGNTGPIRGRRSTVRFAAAVCLLLAAMPAVSTAGPLDALAFSVRSVYAPEGSEPIETTQDGGIIGVPALLDIDTDGDPDVLVQLQVDAARITLRVAPLPTAPEHLPLLIEGILADPRQGSTLRVAFGYDALADTAPEVFSASLLLGGTGRVTSFSADMETVEPGDTIGVLAEVFEQGPAGERIDPQRGRVDFTPVPTVAHFGGLAGSDLGLQQSTVDLGANIETVAVIVIESVNGDDVLRLDATVDKVPSAATLQLTQAPNGTRTLDYTATARVGVIFVSVTNTDAGVLQDEFFLRLTDMALSATLIQDTATHSTFVSESPIGIVEVGSASGGAVKLLSHPGSYLFSDDADGIESLAIKVFGLSRFELESSDPFLIDATLTAGPFLVLANDGDSRIEARINDLPSNVRLEVSSANGTVDYTGSSVIDELTLVATDPAGVTGRATKLDLLMRSIPTTLSLSFAQEANAVTLDAGGQVLGLIEVQLTSGPDTRLDPAFDGILLEDLADRYVLFGRITGLKKVVVTGGPPPDLLLQTTGGRIFKIDLNELKGSKVEYVRATIDRLVESIRVRLEDTAGSNKVIYEASAPTNSLTFDTNSGDRWSTHLDVSNPLPARLEVCASGDGACTNDTLTYRGSRPRNPDAGSVAFKASEHTTINMLDCIRPLNSSCASNPTKYTSINNWRVRLFQMDAGASSIGDSGYIWENTSDYTSPGCSGPPAPSACRYTVSGTVTVRDEGAGSGFQQVFGSGFWADNRLGRWSLFGLSKTKTGSVNCAGSGLSVWVFGLQIGVTSFLC